MKKLSCFVVVATILVVVDLTLASTKVFKRPERPELASLEELRTEVETYMRGMGMMVKARIILTEKGLELEVVPEDEDERVRRRAFKQWRKSSGVIG